MNLLMCMDRGGRALVSSIIKCIGLTLVLLFLVGSRLRLGVQSVLRRPDFQIPLHQTRNKTIFAHKVHLYTNYCLLIFTRKIPHGFSDIKLKYIDPVLICSRGVQLTQKVEPLRATENRLVKMYNFV